MERTILFFCFSVAFPLSVVIATERNDGGKAFSRPLNDGNLIPTLGLGTFLGFDEKGQKDPKPGEATRAVEWAIDNGYRLIDTAPIYRTEEQIGLAIDNKIKAGTVKREDMFIVTKLPSTHHDRSKVVSALQDSLKSLKLAYVDLYLIHWPMAYTAEGSSATTDYLDTWKGMEDAKKLGLARSIGLSNFNVSQIQRVLDNAEIKPTVNQVEVNLNLRQSRLIDFCKSKDIVVMAYAPFGGMFDAQKGPAPKKDDPQLLKLAEKHHKSTPQVALRYLIQRGLVPIPKSTNQGRIEQNINVFSFELDKEDMQILDGFNKDYRTVLPSFWQDHPYYPFEKTDKPIESPF